MHFNTPLITERFGDIETHLKMECDQPTGSFKIRGIGRLCRFAREQGAAAVVSSSGGNAGLAAAYAARELGMSCSVIVPETTPQLTVDRLGALGAQVRQEGRDWDAADALARQVVEQEQAFYVHPFDHPEIWAGHATLIHEAADLMEPPDAVVVAVGGGGLLSGLAAGMADVGWGEVPLVAVETEGAASLNAAVAADALVDLDTIDTIAITMGARRVASQALTWTRRRPVQTVTVSDAQALAGSVRFANDQRRLVEPACGAALAVVYEALIPVRRPLVVVCGGAGVTLDLLRSWGEQLDQP
ncbi:MAG: pyridoxal-phosphate dependent enzyme [Pseudomonadota bacterium]